jgi:HAD superfamily hydrolase (TIGR01509 family)
MRSDRVALSPDAYAGLRARASKRYATTASQLGNVVLDEYLAAAERFYHGRERSRETLRTVPSMRAIDAVIFDMDGVLCDSEIASRNAAVSVLNVLYGVTDVQPHDFEAFTGMGEGRFLVGVAELYGVKNFDEAAAKEVFFDLYIHGGYIRAVKAYPGVKSLIKRIRASGLKVGVASAADRIKVNANLIVIGLDDEGLFDFITSSDDVKNKKPAPDVFLAAATGLGVDPTRCVVVEDAVAGVQAAKAAGMRCIAVTTSLPVEELTAAGPDLIRGEPALVSLEDLFGAPLDTLIAEETSGLEAESDPGAPQSPIEL